MPMQGRNPLPALLLLSALAASVGAAQPFPSFLLDTSRVYGPDAEDASTTASATGDSVVLVVWNRTQRIRACRLTHDFRLLDSACLDISGIHPRSVDHEVDVAWSGESFLVVWRASGFDTSRIMGTLVSEDGSVVRRFTIDSDGRLYGGPLVAYDGTYYQVVWGESGAARFTRVTTAGSVLGPSQPVCPAGGRQQHVTIASTDGASLVAFGDSRQPEGIGLYANIIYPDGTLLDTTPIRIRSASPPPAPAVAHDGLNFVVAWAERGDAAELRAARVTAGGAVLDSGGVPVGQVPLVRDLGAGAWKDTTLLVCVTSQDSHFQVRGWRLDNDLNVLVWCN